MVTGACASSCPMRPRIAAAEGRLRNTSTSAEASTTIAIVFRQRAAKLANDLRAAGSGILDARQREQQRGPLVVRQRPLAAFHPPHDVVSNRDALFGGTRPDLFRSL